jgi:hypothetical protein
MSVGHARESRAAGRPGVRQAVAIVIGEVLRPNPDNDFANPTTTRKQVLICVLSSCYCFGSIFDE